MLIETYCRHCGTTSPPGEAGTCCRRAVMPGTPKPIVTKHATINWCEQHFFEELLTIHSCRNEGCKFYESAEDAKRRHRNRMADVARGLPYEY